MSNTTIFNLSDLNISTGRINVKSKKNNLVSVYSNTISKYYSVTITNGLPTDHDVVLYDGQDNTGTYLGVLLVNTSDTYTVTSGYIYAEWDNPLTQGDVSFTSDDSDIGNPVMVNADKTLGLSVVTTYITFSSASSFTLATYDTIAYWDGTLYYSTDTTTWNTWNGATTINSGFFGNEYVIFMRGSNNTVITGSNSGHGWVLSGTNISCYGNIENLLDYTTVTNGNHPTMADYCYSYMFYGCTSLTTAPKLPATRLSNYCYSNMFRDCVSMTTPPVLPATTLASYCYYGMFYGCTSLTTAPKLPATRLAIYCYCYMFFGCTALTTPAIMAGGIAQATSAHSCCFQMYFACTSLYIYTSSSGHAAFYKAITYSTSSSATNYQSTYRMFYYCYIDGTKSTTNYLTAGTQYYY